MAGAEEGRKDRPAIVLALSVTSTRGATRVLIVAVTHTPPNDPADAVPFPMDLKRAMGLDDLPAWIVTTEGNAFDWPGPDLRPVPRRSPRTIYYGRISERLLQQIAASYLANRKRQRGRMVQRSV
jgi:hypothetical protein